MLTTFYRLMLFFCFFSLSSNLFAQLEELELPPEVEYQIESYLENIGEEVNFDYNTIFEELEYRLQAPINLNDASQTELQQLGLLSELQISQLLQYRIRQGNLLAIYELQAIPSFDLETIYRIRPFITVSRSLDQLNRSAGDIFRESKKDLFLRWGRDLQNQRGYQTSEDGDPPRFQGDPNRLYLRYFQHYGNRMSVGFTMEKDPGEPFWQDGYTKGFDFNSFHFFYKKVNRIVDRVVIGDFRAHFGQGLILNTDFAPNKGALVTQIKQSGPTINRFTSVNEQNYFRGAATTLQLTSELQLTLLASYRKRDGIFNVSDTTDREETLAFTSLQLSGLHRTASELAAKNSTGQYNGGISLKYKKRRGHIALNGLYSGFDQSISRNIRPYNQFYFSGKNLLNASLDYQWNYRNFVFFGETAWSDNQRLASVNGLMANLHRTVSMSMLYRYFPRDFHNLYGQSFTETNGNINEQGLYVGLDIHPNRFWKLSLYADQWRHPWLRFRSDAPSRGAEYLARLAYTKKRDMTAYVHFRFEKKQESFRIESRPTEELLFRNRSNFRVHIAKKINKSLELRTRAELSWFSLQAPRIADQRIYYDEEFRLQKDTRSQGFLLYQDVLYRPIDFPLSITARYAIFDVDRYDARIYAFENDLTYQFSIPAYYNRGHRFYVNCKYRLNRQLTGELRFARTFWANQDHFGSGNTRIEGQQRSALKAQLRWRIGG